MQLCHSLAFGIHEVITTSGPSAKLAAYRGGDMVRLGRGWMLDRRHHLHRDMRQRCHVSQGRHLLSHHGRAADATPQRYLVN